MYCKNSTRLSSKVIYIRLIKSLYWHKILLLIERAKYFSTFYHTFHIRGYVLNGERIANIRADRLAFVKSKHGSVTLNCENWDSVWNIALISTNLSNEIYTTFSCRARKFRKYLPRCQSITWIYTFSYLYPFPLKLFSPSSKYPLIASRKIFTSGQEPVK